MGGAPEGALTAAEQVEMRKHPALGRDVILNAEARVGVRDDATLEMAKDIVYTHHERWDGTGYPRRLRGTEIPIEGRVMAVVDVYDATTTRTLYRPPMSHDDAVKFIVDRTATHFDPAVVEAFLRVPRERLNEIHRDYENLTSDGAPAPVWSQECPHAPYRHAVRRLPDRIPGLQRPGGGHSPLAGRVCRGGA